jgi:hypothetical protein
LKAELQSTGAWDQLFLTIQMGQPIDASVFNAIVNNKLQSNLPSTVRVFDDVVVVVVYLVLYMNVSITLYIYMSARPPIFC